MRGEEAFTYVQCEPQRNNALACTTTFPGPNADPSTTEHMICPQLQVSFDALQKGTRTAVVFDMISCDLLNRRVAAPAQSIKVSHTPGAGPGPIPRPTRFGPFSFLTCSQERPCRGYPSSKAGPPSSSTPISSSTCGHKFSACLQLDRYHSLCLLNDCSLSCLPELVLCHNLPETMPQPCLSQRSAKVLELRRVLYAILGWEFAANL